MSGKFWDEAWSLVEGCTPVSEACDNCWLAGMSYRFDGKCGQVIKEQLWDGRSRISFTGQVNFREDRLDAPLRKRKPTTFVIWSDLFHPAVTLEEQLRAFARMVKTPQHTYLIVTKRPDNALRFVGHWGLAPDPVTGFTGSGEILPENAWLICTAENQERADERIPHLLKIPGKRGLIIEPMLGPVELDDLAWDYRTSWDDTVEHRENAALHQVILGPENGPGKRPMEESWAQAVEDQCKAAGVPFWRKDQERGELAWRTKA